jgi:hypothetical protein
MLPKLLARNASDSHERCSFTKATTKGKLTTFIELEAMRTYDNAL